MTSRLLDIGARIIGALIVVVFLGAIMAVWNNEKIIISRHPAGFHNPRVAARAFVKEHPP